MLPFFHFLIKYWFRFLACVLMPPLVVGVFFLLSSRSYATHLQYTWNLNSVSFEIFRARFYSQPNLELLSAAFKKSQLTDDMSTWTSNDLAMAFPIQVTPSYIDYQNKQNLRLSLERSWAENVEKLENLSAKLVTIGVIGSEETCLARAQIIASNIRNQIPLFVIQHDLDKKIIDINNKLVGLEQEINLLERNRHMFQSLSNQLKELSPEKWDVDVALHFNEKGASFLPLSLRRENVAQNLADVLANLEEKRATWQVELSKKEEWLKLAEFIEELQPTDFHVDRYLQFLSKQMEPASGPLKSQLQSHQFEVENLVRQHAPLVSSHFVEPQAKGTVFASVMMLFVSFSAVLGLSGLFFFGREWLMRGPGQTSS